MRLTVEDFKSLLRALRQRLRLPADDLLRDAAYRRLFTSILMSSIGGQVSMLAVPLTAFLVTAWRLARRKYFAGTA